MLDILRFNLINLAVKDNFYRSLASFISNCWKEGTNFCELLR